MTFLYNEFLVNSEMNLPNCILAAASVVVVNCWSVSLAARTQVSLTFIKMFALVLIIVPGITALANGQNHTLHYSTYSIYLVHFILRVCSKAQTFV